MDILNIPIIEVYQVGKKWCWKVSHPHGGELIASSVQKFHKRDDCIKDIKTIGRFLSAWAVANEVEGRA